MSIQISYSDYIVSEQPLKDRIKTLIGIGASGIEISMEGILDHELHEGLEYMGNEMKNNNVIFSVHPPIKDINLASTDQEERQHSIRVHKNAINFARDLHAAYVVIHPGYYIEQNDREKMIALSKDSIEELNQYAKSLHIPLAIENVGDTQTTLFSQETYIDFLKEMDQENIFYLIDTGHGHITKWDLVSLIDRTKNRLIALHIHDNMGEEDSHLAIGEGSINWEKIFQVLQTLDQKIYTVLEYSPKVDIHKLKYLENYISA